LSLSLQEEGQDEGRTAGKSVTGWKSIGIKKAAFQRLFFGSWPRSTLARLEARVALADHEHFAATAHNLAVTVPLLGGLQRGKHLHGRLLERNKSRKRASITI
jgi:hypothetical protein